MEFIFDFYHKHTQMFFFLWNANNYEKKMRKWENVNISSYNAFSLLPKMAHDKWWFKERNFTEHDSQICGCP